MMRLGLFACLLLLLVPAGRAALPKEAMPLRDAFESSLSGLDGERAERIKQLGLDYETALRKLRTDLESAGQLRPLVAVHDEVARFTKSREPAAPSGESVDLAALQALYQGRVLQVQYSNDVEVIRLAERYVQALAELRDGLDKAHAAEAVKGVDEERDRLLSLGRLRAALRTTLTRPAPPPDPEAAAFGSNTNAVQNGKTRSPRLYRLNNEDVAKVMGYNMELTLSEDASRLKVRESQSGMTSTRSEDGPVVYVPRVTITARNAEIPPDAELTIDYYSRSLTDTGCRKESSETLALPHLARGESATLQGSGISLWRSLSTTHTGRGPDAHSYSGSEFHGLVLTIHDAQHNVLLLRFTPQQLARELDGAEP